MKGLIKIQSELKVPKNQYNSFGKYKYRNAEDILEAVKPLLARENLLMLISDEPINIGDRIYIMSTVTISNGENKVTTQALAREPLVQKGMNDSQITGSASSYARKYALNGMFCIDDTKDADSINNTKEPTPIKSKSTSMEKNEDEKEWLNPNSENYKKVLAAMINGYTITQVRDKYKVSKEVTSKLENDIKQSIANKIIKKE